MNKLEPGFEISDVEILSREKRHDGFLRIDLLKLKHRLFAGGWSQTISRELLVKPQAVGILLYDPHREEVVMVRQFRVGIIDERQSPWLLELVAGMVGEGEALEKVALREAQEESNCIPTDIFRICDYYNSPGGSNEKITLFCGRVDSQGVGGNYGLSEENEDIEVVVLSLEQAMSAVGRGLTNNAMTIIALQWLQLHKQELTQRWRQVPD